MSFSLKLQIVNALDQTTRLHDGIQWFLGTHKKQRELTEADSSGEQPLSSYQRAVKCLLQKQVNVITNPFMPSGLFSYIRVSGWFLLLSGFMEISEFKANSVDPDQKLHSAASSLGQHCLPMSF